MKLLRVIIAVLFVLCYAALQWASHPASSQTLAEAPASFENLTNGLTTQAVYDADRFTFEKPKEIADGLGPILNRATTQSCGGCHQLSSGRLIGGLYAGHLDAAGNFVAAPGGPLVQQDAIDPRIQEVVTPEENIRSFRMTLSILGAGFIEAIDDNTLSEIANAQARQTGGQIKGQIINVPVLEAPGVTRVGRFGWKNQHASLLSSAADDYLNHLGITNYLFPQENTSWGRSVAAFDAVPDIEDTAHDIEVFARFIRSTQVPPRDAVLAAKPEARAGQALFTQIGCAVCHVQSITTAPAGTLLNGGTFIVPPALGSKVIHPYSDFLLHDVGTGDGIVQNGGQSTANKLRTPPLWGLRTRHWLMHDGQSFTYEDAIGRHRGEAEQVIQKFKLLSAYQRAQLLCFLQSL
jgi:CxxC motif-containing protein (DUF1111 family)